jgi:hypothetical protein
MSSQHNAPSALTDSQKLRKLAELFIEIHETLFGDPKLRGLVREYDELAAAYLKEHESFQRHFPDPALGRQKFDAFVRSQASQILQQRGQCQPLPNPGKGWGGSQDYPIGGSI